jgi:cellulose biosynthesis protein BcsQ
MAPEGHQNSIFNTSKVKKKNKDTYGIYPTKFASSTQNHEKIIETPNQSIRTKFSKKKNVFLT